MKYKYTMTQYNRNSMKSILLTIILVSSIVLLMGCNLSNDPGNNPEMEKVAMPVFSHPEGTSHEDMSVGITCSTIDAVIYYTQDGSLPTKDSTEYSAPILISGNGTTVTIKALALKKDMKNSDIAASTYHIIYNQAAAPIFNREEGSYDYALEVTITCATEQADIYYTLNGDDSLNSSTLYTHPVLIDKTTTIRAFARKDQMTDSEVVSKTYTIDFEDVASPAFDPAPGTYHSEIEVTITCPTDEADIYYTTNEEDPTTASALYTIPIPVTITTTVKAVAVKSGMDDSSVGVSEYVITYPVTLGGSQSDMANSIIKTTDNNYVIVGTTESFDVGGGDVYAIKIDADGNEIWSATYGGLYGEIGYDVTADSSGGCVIAGHTYSYGAGYIDLYALRINETGALQWYKTFGGSLAEVGRSVAATSDNGFIFAGYTEAGSIPYNFYIVKTDSNGIQQWIQTINGGTSSDVAHEIIQTTDGGYALTGYTASYGASEEDFILMKLSVTGTTQWVKTYGGPSLDMGNHLIQTSDGGYLLTGYSWHTGAGQSDVYVVKTDSAGNEEWTKILGYSGQDSGLCVIETSSKDFIIGGVSDQSNNIDIYVIKIDPAGNILWENMYGGDSNDYAQAIVETENHNFIIAGHTYSYGEGGRDVYCIKIDNDGNQIF